MVNQSLYTVRALTYVDMNKILLSDLKDILVTYPEWCDSFLRTFKITFNLCGVRREQGGGLCSHRA